MPRLQGQIDQAKQAAVLDAARAAFAEKGLSASLDEIARRAGVSRQTIYNQFGSKPELIRALVRQRVDSLTAPLRRPGAICDPKATLAAYAESVLNIVNERSYSLMRMVIQAVDEFPDLAQEVYNAGPQASHAQLAEFLKAEIAARRLSVSDPDQAAGFFLGMVLSHRHTAALLRQPVNEDPEHLRQVAEEVTRRFLMAYAS